jgi:hypothetical protein
MRSSLFICAVALIVSAFTKPVIQEEVELVCVKRHSTSNTCHYNFKIGGINYRYLDIGCKGKKEDIIKRVKEGELGLAKEWKIACPEPKEKPNQ